MHPNNHLEERGRTIAGSGWCWRPRLFKMKSTAGGISRRGPATTRLGPCAETSIGFLGLPECIREPLCKKTTHKV